MKDEEPLSELIERHQAAVDDAASNTEAKRALAAALRELLDELNATSAPPEAFEPHTARLRALADDLRRHPPATAGASPSGYSGMETFHDRSPIVGLANPLAPPAQYERFDDERCVRGTVEFGKAFEGGPGLVHGGFLAALLDEVLGVVTIYSGNAGLTGEYTVRFERPTRIKMPLRFEARFDRREGRKLYVSADLWDGDTLTVKAHGTFIAVDASKFESFHAERSERIGER